ncbi:MAG: methyltransferase domain-containing protein, partial [Kiloniellaceae bacterium]
MDRPDYALKGFESQFEMAGRPNGDSGFTALELGPGDSLFSALVVHAFGGRRCWLVDAGAFADTDLSLYRQMADYLKAQGLPAVDLSGVTSVSELLEASNANYLTSGLTSLREIPDESVDFNWSRAVLEHIRRHEFRDTVQELRRILRPGGACSHRVDLSDHLDGNLNNLRFSDRWWESEFMAKSGFYTNRIRFSEMLEHFSAAGFAVEVKRINRWDQLPTPKARMARRFRSIDDDELR